MARRDWNRVTRANIIDTLAVNPQVDDVRALYGCAGVELAEKLVVEGLAKHGERNGGKTYSLTPAGRRLAFENE